MKIETWEGIVTSSKLTQWILALLVILSLASYGCGTSDNANASTGDSDDAAQQASNEKTDDEATDEEENKEEAVPIEVAQLEAGEIEAILNFSSNLEAENSVQVFSQAKRQVTHLLVEEGDAVRIGQLLIRLQDDEQRSALAKAESQVAKAEREYKQQERLFEQELISEQTFNDATYELDQLKISLEDARRELSYTEVKAPITGTITGRMISKGDQVQIGQHLFDLVDFNSIVARIFVPEKYMHQLRTGQQTRISAQALGDEHYVTQVKRIAPIVDPKSGTVKVTVDVGRHAGLRPGMYVDVELVTAVHPQAILVPKRAVIYDNDQMYVYRLAEESRVERVFIEAQLADKFNIEPLEGLAIGDQIVVAGQSGLKDGALVSLPGDDTNASADPEAVESTDRASL